MTDQPGPDDATADDIEVPGLAGERTDLAWSRSGVALVVAGAAIVRRIVTEASDRSGRVVVFSLLGIGAAVWVIALWWAHGAVRTTMEGRAVAGRHSLLPVTVGTVLFAATALVLAALPPAG